MKNKNYTKEQENQIRELSPITYDIAVELGKTFGKKLRSVIAKACSMDGVVYVARPRAAKDGNPTISKTQIVENIARFITTDNNLEGLEKATKISLNSLEQGLKAEFARGES
jgi:hypothetical protein